MPALRRAGSARQNARAGLRRPAAIAAPWLPLAAHGAWDTRRSGKAWPEGSAVSCQRALVVLATIEDAKDRDNQPLVIDGVCDHGPPLVVGESQPGTDAVAGHAPVRKQQQTFAGLDDGAAVVQRNLERRTPGDVQVDRFELIARLRGVDDLVACQAFADAFLWAAARRALTALAATAREGSAFSLS